MRISRCTRWAAGRPPARPHEQHELAAGHRAQQPLDQGGAEEAGGAGDGDALAGQRLGDWPDCPLSPLGRLAALALTLLCLPFGRERGVRRAGAESERAGRAEWPSGRERRSMTARGRPTRDRILEAALDQFGSRGFEAVSLDDIASDVGVAKQTVLYWFPSKDHLLGAVLQHTADELGVAVEAAVRAAPDDPLERVEAVVKAAFRPAVRRPALLGLVREVEPARPAAVRAAPRPRPPHGRGRGGLPRAGDGGRAAAVRQPAAACCRWRTPPWPGSPPSPRRSGPWAGSRRWPGSAASAPSSWPSCGPRSLHRLVATRAGSQRLDHSPFTVPSHPAGRIAAWTIAAPSPGSIAAPASVCTRTSWTPPRPAARRRSSTACSARPVSRRRPTGTTPSCPSTPRTRRPGSTPSSNGSTSWSARSSHWSTAWRGCGTGTS